MVSVRSASTFVAFSLLVACGAGEGSRIPPFLPSLPNSQLVGIVHDADAKAVVGAIVTVDGARTTTRTDGRFALPNPPTGSRQLTVDGTNATADGSDTLGKLTVRIDVASGEASLDRPIVLPDTAAGTSQSISLGNQTASTRIDGSAASGAILDIAAGTVVSLGGSSSGTTALNLSHIGRDDLPSPLPASLGVPLATRAIWISPPELTFSAGVTLSFPNDLALPVSASATLVRLDPAGGDWATVGTGTVAAGGARIALDTADLRGGGLYVFATPIPQSASISGRIVDADADPVVGAAIAASGIASTRTDGDGRFTIGPLPTVDGGNTALSLPIVVTPPARNRPTVFRGTVGANDIELDTERVGIVRFLAARRGREVGLARAEFGGQQGVARARLSDGVGIGEFASMPLGWVGANISWTEGLDFVRASASGELRSDERNIDLQLLLRLEESRQGEFRGRLLALTIDEEFAAPLGDAVVQGKNDPNTNDQGRSTVRGDLLVPGDRFGEPTASIETQAGGKTVRSAYTLANVDNNRTEFPLKVARRQPLGAFDDHAVVRGQLTAVDPANVQRRVLVHPRYRENDFWHRALTGQSFAGRLPRRVDPDVVGGTEFRVGLPVGQAFVTATAGTTSGGAYVPREIGARGDLATSAGEVLDRDIDLALEFDQAVTLPGLLSSLDSSLGVSAIRYDCGALRGDGVALDLFKSAAGTSVTGVDLRVPLPPRTGPFAGVTWLVACGASGTKSSATVSQTVYFRTQEATATPGAFLAIPEITSPRPGTTVASASEFEVTWNAPAGTDFYEMQLESTVGNDVRNWNVLLPGDRTSFQFQQLVRDAPKLLEGARTWTLTLRAFRIARGHLFNRSDSYQRLVGNVFSLRAGERGIDARSTWRLTFSTP